MYEKSIYNKYDNWLFNTYKISDKGLSIYRIIYSLFILLIIGVPNFCKVLNPHSEIFYNPPFFSFSTLFNDFPPVLLYFISFSLPLLYILLLIGYKTRIISLFIALLSLIGFNFLYSYGKISHGSYLFWLIPFFMSFTNWGSFYTINNSNYKNADNSWPIVILALSIGFFMFSSGFSKLFGGWLDLNSQATCGNFYRHYLVKEKQEYLSFLLLNINSKYFWEFLDYFVVLFEVFFLLAIFKRDYFHFFIFIAFFFHAFNFFFFNINFNENIVIYLLFFDWGQVSFPRRYFNRFKIPFSNYIFKLFGFVNYPKSTGYFKI